MLNYSGELLSFVMENSVPVVFKKDHLGWLRGSNRYVHEHIGNIFYKTPLCNPSKGTFTEFLYKDRSIKNNVCPKCLGIAIKKNYISFNLSNYMSTIKEMELSLTFQFNPNIPYFAIYQENDAWSIVKVRVVSVKQNYNLTCDPPKSEIESITVVPFESECKIFDRLDVSLNDLYRSKDEIIKSVADKIQKGEDGSFWSNSEFAEILEDEKLFSLLEKNAG